MATTAGFKFPGPVGTKRRRMRSGGNVSTMSNDEPVVTLAEADDVGEKIVQTSKCKGATTIPIFLKSKYYKKRRRDGHFALLCLPKVEPTKPGPEPGPCRFWFGPCRFWRNSGLDQVHRFRKAPPLVNLLLTDSILHLFAATETYKMIDTCDQSIASWWVSLLPDGDRVLSGL